MSLINIKQYADKNSLSRQRIYQLIKAGRLKSAKKIDGVWLIDENDEIVKVVRKPYVPPKKNKQDREKNGFYKSSIFEGFVTVELYAKLHKISVTWVRKLIKDNRLKSAIKIDGKWFIDPDDKTMDKRKNSYNNQDISDDDSLRFLDDFVTVEQYAKIHGVSTLSIRKKILQNQLKSIVIVSNHYFINKNEPLIDNRVKSGKYVSNLADDISDICEFALEKYGINDLSGAIVALLSDEDFLKTKRTKRSKHFIDSWHMEEKEFESLQDCLFLALHPDKKSVDLVYDYLHSDEIEIEK